MSALETATLVADLVQENVYGHRKRLAWIVGHVRPHDRIVELGCGTGWMITRPLVISGYDVVGVDLDVPSIAFGQEVFRKQGIDPHRLRSTDLQDLPFVADVIVASEVLEHVPDCGLDGLLATAYEKLRPGGKLLVTVPNGYGGFEIEAWLWNRARLGWFFQKFRLDAVIVKLKMSIWPVDLSEPPSTLSPSPHVQRFTLNSIQRKLSANGFKINETGGSVIIAGPLSNLFFTGVPAMMRFNSWLGSRMPSIAAGFYLACERPL